MATRKPKNTAALQPDDNPIPRISLNEVGYGGLRVSANQILDERNRVFTYPNLLQVVSEMSADSTVATALNVYNMMLNRVQWTVKPPSDASDVEKQRAEVVSTMMDDMEGSWTTFMTNVTTYLPYGYAAIEKVLYRRLKKNGSKFNDGLVGIKKLAPRAQETITNWYWSEDGRELLAVGQSLKNLDNPTRYQSLTDENGVLRIDRKKLLIFSADSTKDNPQGKSILRSVFLPYKQLTLLKDQLMLGVAKDLQGIPTFFVPPQYLDPKASDADKAALAAIQSIGEGLAKGTISNVILPKITDQDGNDKFTFVLTEAKAGKAFDIPSVISGLQTNILTSLSVDIATMGNSSVGSYSLASTKQNILSMAIEYRLKEIKEVLNSDLMRQIYEMNGWDTDKIATFEYGDIVDINQDELGKYIQRTAAVGMLIKDHETVNKVREGMGVSAIPEGTALESLEFSGNSSRSGDGMEEGMGNGTGKSNGQSGDSSSGNKENA